MVEKSKSNLPVPAALCPVNGKAILEEVCQNFSNDFFSSSIGFNVRLLKQKSIEAWQYVKHASRSYCRALDMDVRDIEALEDLDRYISIFVTFFRNEKRQECEIKLIPKNTCGCPYEGDWEYLLQPRVEGIELPHYGGGTTYIAALPPEINQLILKSVKEGRAAIKNGRIWP
jgi:hypothetical protein